MTKQTKNLEPKMKPKVSETPVLWFHLKINGSMNYFYGFKAVAILSNSYLLNHYFISEKLYSIVANSYYGINKPT